MINKIFLIGIVAGLAAAIGLAAIVSTLSSHGTAQMMGNNYQGQMGQGMMYGQQANVGQPSSAWWQWNDRASFSSYGFSNVDHVQITGISISGEHDITVNLRYDGNVSKTPSITVIAATNPSAMMARMHGSMGYGFPGMMTSGYEMSPMMPGYFGYNDSTQLQQMQTIHNQMTGGSYNGYGGMMAPYFNQTFSNFPVKGFQSQTGSSVVNSGWEQTGISLKIKLEGEGSTYDSLGIHVMVFPLTS